MTKAEIQRLVSAAILAHMCPYRAVAMAQWGRYNDSMRNALRPALSHFYSANHAQVVTTHPANSDFFDFECND